MAAVAAAAAVTLLAAGRWREAAQADGLRTKLEESARPKAGRRVDFSTFDDLPAPVARYLRVALADGQPLIRTARMRQSGRLRTATDSARWMSFRAQHLAVPPAIGFVWDATAQMPLGLHVRVLDSYVGSVGGGRISVLSALPVATADRAPELDSGALHRYLAEAVWYPSALLPESGVIWSAVDDRSATATLGDGPTSVSLEFSFNDENEVIAIYTPGRFGRFDGAYRQAGWEGHFSGYMERAGMRLPSQGEVGWYDDAGVLQIVWIGTVEEADYAFVPDEPGGPPFVP